MKETHTVTQTDLGALAERVLYLLSQEKKDRASVILLEGDLGAGKTTFTQALAEQMGVTDHVNSPTFILKKEYKSPHATFSRVVHIDAYRFVRPEEAKVLRLEEDLKNNENVIVIEWPSKMTYLKSDVHLDFSIIDEDTREVTLTFEKDI